MDVFPVASTLQMLTYTKVMISIKINFINRQQSTIRHSPKTKFDYNVYFSTWKKIYPSFSLEVPASNIELVYNDCSSTKCLGYITDTVREYLQQAVPPNSREQPTWHPSVDFIRLGSVTKLTSRKKGLTEEQLAEGTDSQSINTGPVERFRDLRKGVTWVIPESS